MKKVLIYTLYGNVNYGNKLQNYAVQSVLSKNNCDAYTVITRKTKDSVTIKVKKIIKKFVPKYSKMMRSEKKREQNFRIFDRSIQKIRNKDKNITDYDYIIVGSDQVWNSTDSLSIQLVKEVNKIKNKKIVGFSGSIAIPNIDNKYKELYTNHFNKMDYISVREADGYKLIKDLTGREDIETLIDPTMLISTEQWDKVAKKPSQYEQRKPEKYILNYFLGDVNDNRKQEIERIAKENDCKIINLLDKSDSFYTCGPSEFLYLEKHAFLVCTDSFHSSVFAFLYDRPFIVFDREQRNLEKMNSRLDNLINTFQLKNRRFNGKITKENLEHDYTEAYKILEKEREKSKKFLRKALDIEDN